MTETQRNPLAKNFSTVSLIKFAFPSMVMMLFMGLYTIVDTVFIARFVNTNALSKKPEATLHSLLLQVLLSVWLLLLWGFCSLIKLSGDWVQVKSCIHIAKII